MLHLVEDPHAPGEAHGVHVVEAEVQQVLGSSGDTVALAGDMRDQQGCYSSFFLRNILLKR